MRMLSPIATELTWPRRTWSSPVTIDVFEDFDRIVESFLRPTHVNTVNFQPSCDVSESKDHYLVSFDMPGVKKEDIKIEVHGQQLQISGERQREMKNQEGEATLRHERVYGKFERSFTLPSTIDTDKIEANYENGVLSIALPKAETAKARSIQIQSGQGGLLSKLLNSKKETNTKDLKDVKPS